MLETASTQYVVRDIRVVMLEPLVSVLAVIGAVYNGVQTHNPPACGLHMLGRIGYSLQSSDRSRRTGDVVIDLKLLSGKHLLRFPCIARHTASRPYNPGAVCRDAKP